MIFEGRIEKVLPLQSGRSTAGNDWRKQEFIFEYFENADQRWSDKVVLNVMGDRIDQYDLHEGEEVKIGFGHRVREYQGRYFNECTIYLFEKKKHESEPVVRTEKESTATTPEGEKDDDLPF